MANNWKKKHAIDIDSSSALFREDGDNGSGLYKFQIEGAVAIHNRLCNNRYAYLADEVGMGKTLTALAVVTLLLERKPDARIMVITPRRIISEQWIERWNEFPQKFLKGFHANLCDPFFRMPRRDTFECTLAMQLIESILGCGSFIPVISAYAFRYYKNFAFRCCKPEDSDLWNDWPREDRWETYFHDWFLPWKNAELTRKLGGEKAIDLLVVDEAQILRNDYNQTNRTFAALLGLHSDKIDKLYNTDEYTASDMKEYFYSYPAGLGTLVDRFLFLSATPMHKKEDNLYQQLAYAEPAGINSDTIKEKTKIGAYMAQRSRTYTNAGGEKFSRYQYRSILPQAAVTNEEHSEQEIFLALTQKLIRVMHANKKNSRFEMGFMETFESYGTGFDSDFGAVSDEMSQDSHESSNGPDANVDKGLTREQSDSGKKTEMREIKAEDNWVVATLQRTWDDVWGSGNGGTPPPHPKQKYFCDEFIRKELLECKQPRKAVVFVRRIKGARQLARAALYACDDFLKKQIMEINGMPPTNVLWHMLINDLSDSKSKVLIKVLSCSDKSDYMKYRDRLAGTPAYISALISIITGSSEKKKPLRFKWASRAFFSAEGMSVAIAFADIFSSGYVNEIELKNRVAILQDWLLWERICWRVRQFFDKKLFGDICSQVLTRENNTHSEEMLLNEKAPFDRTASYAYPVSSSIGTIQQKNIKKRFNTPLWPDVLVTTDMMREGVDLHLFCDRMMHFGLAWSPGDLEQRTGRCDRCNSRLEREIRQMTGKESVANAYPVYFPYVERTVDKKQVSKMLGEVSDVEKKYLFGGEVNTQVKTSSPDAAKLYRAPEVIVKSYNEFVQTAEKQIAARQKLSDDLTQLLHAESAGFPSREIELNPGKWCGPVVKTISGLYSTINLPRGWSFENGNIQSLLEIPKITKIGKPDIVVRIKPLFTVNTIQLVLILKSRLFKVRGNKANSLKNLQNHAENLHPAAQICLDYNEDIWVQKAVLLGEVKQNNPGEFAGNLCLQEFQCVFNDIARFVDNIGGYRNIKAPNAINWEKALLADKMIPLCEKNGISGSEAVVYEQRWLKLEKKIQRFYGGNEKILWQLNYRFPEAEFRYNNGHTCVCFFHPVTNNYNDLQEAELNFMVTSILRASVLADGEFVDTMEDES